MSITGLLDELSAFSATDPRREGVTRLPFTPSQIQAARWLEGRMAELGLETQTDACGTVAGYLPGHRPEVLILGSHYDSVPLGGRYDGVFGVIAALETVRRLRQAGERPCYSLLVLALNDEEGVRLNESFLSSHMVCGDWTAADRERVRDRETGQTLGELLDASPLPHQFITLPQNARAYLECHVEQGPVLDRLGLSTAIVDHIVGVYHGFYRLWGVQNHAGTTPMDCRADPVPVFGEIAARLPALAKDFPGSVATIGHVEIRPGAPNVIPRYVEFSVDLRSASPQVLSQLQAQTWQLIQSKADGAGLSLTRQFTFDAPSVTMDPAMTGLLERCTGKLGLPVFHMDSGAGHDAQIFAQKLPTAMLFVRSQGGISHSVDEFTREEDLERACDILFEFVKEPF